MATRSVRLAPDYRIIQRRQRDEQIERMQAVAKQNEKCANMANWEMSTQRTIEVRTARARAEAAAARDADALNARRKQLAELLNREQAEYEQEYKSSMETDDDRQARLKARALNLQAKREAAREEFAAKMLRKRLQEQQDEMRLERSKLYTKFVAKERQSQLVEKEERQREEKLQEQHFSEMWLNGIAAKEARERQEEHERLQRNVEMREMLDTQTQQTKDRREAEAAALEEDRKHWRTLWEEEEKAEIAKEREKIIRQNHERKMVQRENLERAAREAFKHKKEEELDIYLLKMQQAKEAREIAAEEANKARMRKEARDLKKYLEILAIKEKSNDNELQIVRKEAEDKAWKKREDQWAREEEERQALMREVSRVRAIQVKEKAVILAKEKEDDKKWTKIMADKTREDEARELLKLRKAQERGNFNKALLVKQMETKKYNQAREKQEELIATRKAANYRRDFETKIQEMKAELLTADIKRDFRRTKKDW